MALPSRIVPGKSLARSGRLAAAALLACGAGCAVGPNYRRPATVPPAAFKETDGWKAAVPGDAAVRAPWWEVFQDPLLDQFESQVADSNQTLAQAAANYEQSRQLARADRATFLPSVSVVGSVVRSKSPSGKSAGSPGAGGASSTYSGSLQAAWEPDLWGRIRRTTEADVAAAQADAAVMAAVRLSLQSTLAQDYISLRTADQNRDLLAHAVEDFSRTVKISTNKYAAGVAAKSDVIAAQTQLDDARSQLIAVGVQRAKLEHAIAVLLGRFPAGFGIEPVAAVSLVDPEIPLMLPSELLERRPDVAQAEREAAAANAKVGIQTAAYFPTVSLTGSAGYEGSPLRSLFTTPFRFWTLGAQAADAILDWGQRHDQVLAARAAYDASAANYRQVVLSAFQEVEDNLSELRILLEQKKIQDAAVAESAEAARIAFNEYNAGTVDYTTVLTAQVTELNNRETALSLESNRLTSSVALIAALGGGWRASDLPTPREVVAAHPSRN